MELGMIGLGKMGANMTRRLMKGGHRVVVFDVAPAAVETLVSEGAVGSASIVELVGKLSPPRSVWLMVPAGKITEDTLQAVSEQLRPGDTILDGGNSNYKESQRRAAMLEERGIHFIDVGTSGGIWGLAEGYSMMIGGLPAIVEQHRPIFQTLAPGPDKGWGHVGPAGAGHFVKMVHNGIEYGIMQAYAEGFHIMQAKGEFGLKLPEIAEIWRYGSVVRSWLLDLAARALGENPELSGIKPWVADSGEGRWTVAEAIDLDVPAPVITLALQERLRSRVEDSFTDKMLAALRNQFGGHAVRNK